MDRLRPPPAYLPLRILGVCGVLAVLLLLLQGGSMADIAPLLTGTMELGGAGPNYLHVLLARASSTFALISMAVLLGGSLALALTCAAAAAGTGAFGMKSLGWAGRALSGVPPMAWALLALVFTIQHWQAPVETLFPYDPPADKDTPALLAGRRLWAWILPATVLALPVFGILLNALALRLNTLLRKPETQQLRARGVGGGSIVHRHLVPHLALCLVRRTRVVLPVLLAFSVPVEDLLAFDGLGQFVGQTLLTPEFPQALPAAIYLAGWMLGLWFLVLCWLDRLSQTSQVEDSFGHGARRSLPCAIAGGVLAVALTTLPYAWSWMAQAQGVWFRELGFALGVVLIAGGLTFAAGMIWQILPYRRSLRTPRLAAAAFSELPVPLVLLVAGPVWLRSGMPLAIVAAGVLLAIPSAALLWQQLRELSARRMVEAAVMLGARPHSIWRNHLLRHFLPSLLHWGVRSTGAVLLWMSVVRYYLPGTAEVSKLPWGAQMRLASENVFDDPSGVLAPAVLLALWYLSLHLLSRAFRTELPGQAISPAVAP